MTSGDAPPSTDSRRRRVWLVWLQVVLGLLLIYALILVFAGTFAQLLFAALGFGPPVSIESSELSAYLRLPFAVLGAVMAGWAAVMLMIVRGPLTADAKWALPALAVPLALWFMLDTGMSLVLGFPTHALFNVPFALALGVPLWKLWVIDRT